MDEAGNLKAIKEWVATNRPDCTQHVEQITNMRGREGDAFILLMTMAFEAGRMFQSRHATPAEYDPHKSPMDYLA